MPRALPQCLADPLRSVIRRPANYAPAFYDVIVSRRAGGMKVSFLCATYWSAVPPQRCMLTREQFLAMRKDHFQICILREFDA